MLSGRTPTKAEKRWLDLVCKAGCIVCRLHHKIYSPAEPHHIKGKTVKHAHFYVLPLCPKHHRLPGGTAKDAFWTARHENKRRFEERYGTEEELWIQTCQMVGEFPDMEDEDGN